MSNVEDGISYVFTWHCLTDACPKCQQLNGKEYYDQNIYQDVLWDAIWGNIWDLNADHSLAHPNCRCQLEVRAIIDWSKYVEVRELEIHLNQTVFEAPKYLWEQVDEVTSVTEMKVAIDEFKSSISEALSNVDQINTAFRRYLMLARRVGLPDDIRQGFIVVQQARMGITQLNAAAGMMSAGGILSFLTGAGMITTTGLFILDQLRVYGAERTAAIYAQIAKEQMQQLESTQIALRRQRY